MGHRAHETGAHPAATRWVRIPQPKDGGHARDGRRRRRRPGGRHLQRREGHRLHLGQERQEDHVQGRRGMRRGQDGDHGVCRFPQEAEKVRGPRGEDSARRLARRPAGDRQDLARQGHRRGIRGSVPVHIGLRFHGNVRRRRSQPRSRPVRPGQEPVTEHHLHRRD